MKELSIEEKAKAYDEAIARAKVWKEKSGMPADRQGILDDIFPELKKSEDERIRRDMIFYFEQEIPQCSIEEHKGYMRKFVALLEKQGEQKSKDKVEQKFKVGDWIVKNDGNDRFSDGSYVLQIKEIYGDGYMLSNNAYLRKPFLQTYRLWTIQDAKDGDVLREESCTFIYEKMKFERTATTHCILFDDGEFNTSSTLSFDVDSTNPATKEQRDLLFQKMKEAGYEWDAEKKELKKIIAPIFHIGDRVRYKGHKCDGVITEITDNDYICGKSKLPISTQDKLELVEQKSALSEEDSAMLDNIVAWIDGKWGTIGGKVGGREAFISFLKNLKERYTWKPSDEQMKALAYAVFDTQSHSYHKNLSLLEQQLKKLREG